MQLYWWDQYNQIISLYLFENLLYGKSNISNELKQFLLDWANYTLKPACNTSGNLFNFAKSNNYYFHFWGHNLLISDASIAAILAWNSSTKSEENKWMKDYAIENNFHWLMGRNPLGICQIRCRK
ncbi:MAG: hypothetical protein ACTSRZ_08660 [Promethearchaeota archaeon]